MTAQVTRSLFALALVASLGAVGMLAQEPAKKTARRLPAYYKDVVTPAQREQIYAVQEKYNTQIDKLQAQIRELTAKRDADVEKVLTGEQRLRVKAIKEAAKKPAAAPK